MTKEEIIEELRKEGVTNLEEFADFLVKKAHKDGNPDEPVVNSAIIYKHGFVTS